MCGFTDGGQVIIPDYLEFNEKHILKLYSYKLKLSSECQKCHVPVVFRLYFTLQGV
jgi:hypothetical protein